MMNKKQKILAIFGLGLILFLTGMFSFVSAVDEPIINPSDVLSPSLPPTNQAVPGGQIEQLQTSNPFSSESEANQQAQQNIENILGQTPNLPGIGETLGDQPPETKAPPLSNTPYIDESGVPDESTKAVGGMAYVVAWFGSQFVKVSAFLIDFVLKLNFKILDKDNPFVTIGWTISRDLTNLFFVLFIIIIAISTILRFEEYAAKSTLAKLIAVALLVNFSLLGAGVFVDFSNMLTGFFLGSATNIKSDNLADKIASVFNPAESLRVKEIHSGVWEKIKGFFKFLFSTEFLLWLTGLAFAFFFSLILGFTLLAIAIMFFIRYIALSMLLVLAPLACLFYILPITKKWWEKWWDSFIRWIFFAPAAAFFIYLTLTMLDKYKSQINSLAAGADKKMGDTAALFENLPTANLGQQLATGLMLIGFIWGGLIVANKLGLEGAKAVTGATKAGIKGFTGWTTRKGIRTVGYPFAGPSEKHKEQIKEGTGGRLARADVAIRGGIRSGIEKLGLFGKPLQKLGDAYRYKYVKEKGKVDPVRKEQKFKGLWASTVGEMAAGSGFFKKKKQKYTLEEGKLVEAEEGGGEKEKPEEEGTVPTITGFKK